MASPKGNGGMGGVFRKDGERGVLGDKLGGNAVGMIVVHLGVILLEVTTRALVRSPSVGFNHGPARPCNILPRCLLGKGQGGAQCFVIIKHTRSFVDFKDRMLLLVTAELKMDVLREREVKDSLERQLQDEQKVRGE